MKKLFAVKQFCSRKKALYFLDKKILSFPAVKKDFLKSEVAPKFGVSYSVFDGEELLEASIRSLRNQADYVNVVWQKTSWRGNPADPNLLKTLQEIQAKGLIDELIFFEPDLKKSPQANENTKRNIGLKAAVKAGVNYFMTIDCDEFYFENELAAAKDFIVKNGITHSYCAQVIYGHKPTLRMIENRADYRQFFSKVDEFSILGGNELAICLVDPTRKLLERKNSKHFVLNKISMHHMMCVRKNKESLQAKYANSSFCGAKEPSFNDKDFVEVPDYFGISAIKFE